MSEFPSTEAQELVTKDLLRAELVETRAALTVRIGSAVAASTALLAAVGILT